MARALPPAKIAAYSGAQLFDICDIANRVAILVMTNFFFVFFLSGDRGGEQHANTVVHVGQIGEEVERRGDLITVGKSQGRSVTRRGPVKRAEQGKGAQRTTGTSCSICRSGAFECMGGGTGRTEKIIDRDEGLQDPMCTERERSR